MNLQPQFHNSLLPKDLRKKKTLKLSKCRGNRTHYGAKTDDEQNPYTSTTEPTQSLAGSKTCVDCLTGCKDKTTTRSGQNPNGSLRPKCALFVPRPKMHPDLAFVVDAWEDLPEPIRVAVLALIRSATGEGQ